jgi:hypothetical protein
MPRDSQVGKAGRRGAARPRALEALERANEVRIQRSEALRALENGETTIGEALADPVLQPLTVLVVLERVSLARRVRSRREVDGHGAPRRLTRRAQRLLMRVGIGEQTVVSALSESRRRALVATVEEYLRR